MLPFNFFLLKMKQQEHDLSSCSRKRDNFIVVVCEKYILRKPKWQSRMDNPEKLATLNTRHRTKIYKEMSNTNPNVPFVWVENVRHDTENNKFIRHINWDVCTPQRKIQVLLLYIPQWLPWGFKCYEKNESLQIRLRTK